MKSSLGMLFIVLLLFVVVGGGAFIWYLSQTAEFSQQPTPAAAGTALPPTDR